MASKSSAKGREGPQRCWSLREIQDLIDVLNKRDIDEFELEESGFKIRIRRGKIVEEGLGANGTFVPKVITPAPEARLTPVLEGDSPMPPETTVASVPPAPAAPEEFHIVKAPIVGTFYAASSPGTPPFVTLGDMVEIGQPLCIIEAMKLMNEIESDVAGEIARILAENGQPVEYGQPLFGIRVAPTKDS